MIFSIFVNDLKLISYSDIVELSEKLRSSSPGFFIHKLNPIRSSRIRHHWNSGITAQTNWWNIPYVNSRWNRLISNNPHLDYIDCSINHLKQCSQKGITHTTMLSIGCGTGSQELAFAQKSLLQHIDAFDVAPNNIKAAQKLAIDHKMDSKLHFFVADFNTFVPSNQYDLILFHSSLHHLKEISKSLQKVASWLNPGGRLIINEYVGPNRIQWSQGQLSKANQLLQTLPTELRTYVSGRLKVRQTAPGILRMVISDPSEAPESESILPALNNLFRSEVFREYGGNILAPLLKGISHHFTELTPTKQMILDSLFAEEDSFLKSHSSDHIFAIYSLK